MIMGATCPAIPAPVVSASGLSRQCRHFLSYTCIHTNQVALLHLMDDFDFERLKTSLMEKGSNINLSNVEYLDVAQFVGLEPLWNFSDAPSFDLHRSRIPTALFRDIVADTGHFADAIRDSARPYHRRSKVLHLVALFGGSIRNTPESLMTYEWPHYNKRQDQLSFQDTWCHNSRVHGGRTKIWRC
ncbi:hypothetical protein EDB87DRAFT_84550 [Lactarius vividus]|nr:hypothetical protein EDB87DRAFT_84550 [Lactarius vividus]